jgi:hypothetical protein
MSYVIDLPRPIEERIDQEAAKAGITPTELVAEVVKKRFGTIVSREEQRLLNRPSIAQMEARLEEGRRPRSAEDKAEAEESMLELMRNLNATRREAGERLLFPDVPERP